jgi:hypothetical protein
MPAAPNTEGEGEADDHRRLVEQLLTHAEPHGRRRPSHVIRPATTAPRGVSSRRPQRQTTPDGAEDQGRHPQGGHRGAEELEAQSHGEGFDGAAVVLAPIEEWRAVASDVAGHESDHRLVGVRPSDRAHEHRDP